jgi:hypothetical protein
VNLGYFWRERANLMLTAYGASTLWLVRGVSLDYQEIARKPFGGPFGAIGLSAAYGRRRHDLFVEVARSVDRQAGGGGGTAFVSRSVTQVGTGELELSARAYGSRYANPYARPISAPDELDGLRARDELGVRARLTQQARPRLAIRALVDVWRSLRAPRWTALAFARADVELSPSWSGGTWVEYRSSGKRTLVAARLGFRALRELRLSLQLQHRWHGSGSAHGQRDVAGVFAISGKPFDPLGVRVRLRYDVEDVFDNHRMPHTVWLTTECTLRLRTRDALRLRYDLRAFLDERESTAVRVPNPEHWMWVEYVFRH